MHCIVDAIHSLGPLAVQRPYLDAVHDVSIILDVIHLTNRFVIHTINAAFQDNCRRSSDQFVVELVGGCKEADLDGSDLSSACELDVERILVMGGCLVERKEDDLGL